MNATNETTTPPDNVTLRVAPKCITSATPTTANAPATSTGNNPMSNPCLTCGQPTNHGMREHATTQADAA